MVSPEPSPPLGLATVLQLVPFQWRVSDRAIVVVDVRCTKSPTAHASDDDAAVTARSSSSAGWSGLATTDHAVPFQCMVSVLSGRKLPLAVSMVSPTAQTSVAEIAVT